MSWFHKYLFHCRCGFHHPCHSSTSIFMHYRIPWSLTSTTKCDILSIITGWLSWYLAHVDWIGIQFNNEGLDMFVVPCPNLPWCLTDSQNRSQIWMIIIRYGRTCPALLIWQIWPEWQTGHRQGRALGQAVLSSWMMVNSTDVYDCMSSTAARQSVSYCLMISLNLCGMSSS